MASKSAASSGSSQQRRMRPSATSYNPAVPQVCTLPDRSTTPSVTAAIRWPRAHEDVASDQSKGACGKPPAPLHIVQDVSYADVHPGKGVVTGHGPLDVTSQEVRKTPAVTACVVLVLRTVQSVE